MIDKVKKFVSDARRVFMISKKPDAQEFSVMAKVTALGIIVIGIIGFIVLLIFTLSGLGK
ncbi:MAG: protein translocase SEC61 complex subunit gamma [Candidatus Diapherotrites archaeon]|nr:protein translocase SEC61 complex subunit gamma [Candidatus Diapherotrites archaeon]